MRNLKKALALVLALMMTVSLMATASASDYADGAQITKTEAVEVMSMINVFQGDNTGNFDPAGNLTRAQAAKIITYMKLGEAVAETLPKDEAPFPDVKADRWYTGYVTYAKAEGIIDGRTDGNFDPNATLTGYEFGKMVLEAAGISGQYTGSSWKLNISTALRGGNPAKANLMANVEAVLNNPISREQACQLAFNGLTYTSIGETTGNFVIVGDGALDGTVCATRSEAAIMISLLAETGKTYTIEAEKNTRGSLGDLTFGLAKTRGTTTFGAPANVWTAGEDEVTVADAAVKSYEKTTLETIKGDLNLKTATATVVVDGQTVATPADKDAIGGNGAQVDVYKTGEASVKVIVVNTYVATIASHAAADAKKETKEQITLKLGEVKTAATKTQGTTFVTDKFTADDKGAVVLYTAKVDAKGEESAIVSVTVPAEVKGTVTRYNSNETFVVGGTTYKLSAKTPRDDKGKSTLVTADLVGAELTLYLDNKGNVIEVAGEAAVADVFYAVLVDYAKSSGWASSTGWSVKLLLTDGSIVEKTLAKVNDDASFKDADVTALSGAIVAYTEKDGAVSLTAVTDDGAGIPEVKRNTPTLKTGLVANNKTIFMVGSKDGKTLTVYTGINTVPNIRMVEDGPAFQVVADKGVAALVYIQMSEPIPGAITSTDVIYVVGEGDTATDADKGTYTTYTAIVNGKVEELEATDDAKGLTDAKTPAVLLSAVTKNDAGMVTEGHKMDGENVISADSIKAPANGIIEIGGKTYSYGESTVVWLVTDDIATVDISAIEDLTSVQVNGYTKDGVIAELFVLVLGE